MILSASFVEFGHGFMKRAGALAKVALAAIWYIQQSECASLVSGLRDKFAISLIWRTR